MWGYDFDYYRKRCSSTSVLVRQLNELYFYSQKSWLCVSVMFALFILYFLYHPADATIRMFPFLRQ